LFLSGKSHKCNLLIGLRMIAGVRTPDMRYTFWCAKAKTKGVEVLPFVVTITQGYGGPATLLTMTPEKIIKNS
jgi:hypothetical protein